MTGSSPGRRAIVRWAMRLFRRDWRQHLLVLVLMILAVGAAVAGSAMAVNAGSKASGRFGSGGALAEFDMAPNVQASAQVDEARRRWGTVDVVAHTSTAVPGSTQQIDVRDQNPQGVFSKPMLAIVSGRYPTADREAALTRRAADLYDAQVGSTVTVGRLPVTVVGIVENPAELDDTFVLVAPGTISAPTRYGLLISRSSLDPSGRRDGTTEIRDSSSTNLNAFNIQSQGSNGPAVAALVLVATTLALALVGLIAAAGFVVVAHRRQRQLGLLAAIGASQRQVRMVMVFNGMIVGVVAALIGAVFGLAGWAVAAPAIERAANHRIDRLDLPWVLIGAIMFLAAAMATLAAWQPARAASRQSVVAALSGRPTPPRPVHRSLLLTAVFVGGGAVAIVKSHATGTHVRPPFLICGILGVVIGVVFVTPAAVRALGMLARRLPFSPRLALRDLARYQARAAAALAAITLGLGIGVGVIALAAANAHAASQGNLSDHEIMIHVRTGTTESLTPAQLAELDQHVAQVVAALGPGLAAVPLNLAFAASTTGGEPSPEPVTLGIRRDANSLEFASMPFVATPEVLAAYGIDPATIEPETDIVTSRTGTMVLLVLPPRNDGAINGKARPDFDAPPPATQHVDLPTWSGAPNSLITEGALERLNLVSRRSAYIVESPHAFTAAQIKGARAAAAGLGLEIETRDQQDSLSSVRNYATLIGALLAIAVVGMTVGLIRGEAARDIRTMTATGASARTRRAVTANTAGALAGLGAVLGIGGAYIALIAAFHAKLGKLTPVPVNNLLVLAMGLPAVAALTGWLLAGREPTAFSRQILE